jgi:hypothetical protein
VVNSENGNKIFLLFTTLGLRTMLCTVSVLMFKKKKLRLSHSVQGTEAKAMCMLGKYSGVLPTRRKGLC